MRIVIDLQGAQSTGSRNRGIGRYTLSLAQGIVRQRGEHEVFLALNGLFPETIESIRSIFSEILPQENIKVWHAPEPVNFDNPDNDWRRKSAELVREDFLASISPDIVLITSLFEGFDNCVLSIGSATKRIPTAVILYDLIPLINREMYLSNPVVEAWYDSKLDHMSRADLLLAISESSRQEGIRYLGFPGEQVFNISTAADTQFRPQQIEKVSEDEVRQRYGLHRPFVMYTGGIDHRKNIEGLIRAYAQLPKSLRASHQLAVVCSIQASSRATLEALAKENGLSDGELVLTGFVPEDDLIFLYNLCKTFVFPSWHEGFGLPALEAMSCGRSVIAANTSSLPEVVGCDDALFDPHSDKSIASKLAQVLSDDVFREKLARHGLEQAKRFSWDASAKTAIAAFEAWQIRQIVSQPVESVSSHRPKLAYVSPLPPERSGIADYSAELLPELARYYDIDVIVGQKDITDPWIKANCSVHDAEWLVNNAHLYERVLYHFGNSHYHQHMFDLVERLPGIVVLHDFFLSGIAAHMAYAKGEHEVNGEWVAALYHNHGFGAVTDFAANGDIQRNVFNYPCNATVLEKALGVIVHSPNSLRLADQWSRDVQDWSVIPLLRVPATGAKAEARQSLGIEGDAFMVCSFGRLDSTKLNRRLLDAWLASPLSRDKRCFLVFVGESNDGGYCKDLVATIRKSGLSDRIRITGWTDAMQYRQYLAAADMGVQLRTLSRGETSAAVLDCMNYGLPTIINANGSMADLSVDAVWMLPDSFSDVELSKGLETLWRDEKKRHTLGARAREVILKEHSPRTCADQYIQVIESYYKQTPNDNASLVTSIAKIKDATPREQDWLPLARDIASNQKPPAVKQLLVDISGLVQMYADIPEPEMVLGVLAELLASSPKGFRIEPVYAVPHEPGYRYARQFILRFLNCPDQVLTDELVEVFSGDIFCGLALKPNTLKDQAGFYQRLRCIGVQLYFVWDFLPTIAMNALPNVVADMYSALKNGLEQADGVVCISPVLVNELKEWLDVSGPKRLRALNLGWFDNVANTASQKGKIADRDNELETAGKFSMSTLPPKESVQCLLNSILGGQWKQQWMPDNVQRFWGRDSRFGTQVGQRIGRDIVTKGQAGFLIFGPYIPLAAGRYQIIICGRFGESNDAGAKMDVACNKGNLVLGASALSGPDDDGRVATLLISLYESCTDLEVRVWVSEGTDLHVSMIEIAPWQDAPEESNTDPEGMTGGDSAGQDAVLIQSAGLQQSAQVLSSAPTVTVSMHSDKFALINADSDVATASRSAVAEVLSDYAQASNDASAPGGTPVLPAMQNQPQPSPKERNLSKDKRKKKR